MATTIKTVKKASPKKKGQGTRSASRANKKDSSKQEMSAKARGAGTSIPDASSRAIILSLSTPTRNNVVRSLRERLGISQERFAQLSGFASRTIAGWESGKPMTEPGRQRIAELQRLQKGLVGVMDQSEVAQW